MVRANRVFSSYRSGSSASTKFANKTRESLGETAWKRDGTEKEKWEKYRKRESESGREGERKREEGGRGEKESAISRSDFTWLLLIYYEALLLRKNRKVS